MSNRAQLARGAGAGAAAAALWAAQQPLDRRLFGVGYDDVQLLGTWVTRGPAWRPVGFALHVANGAAFGAAYAALVAHAGPAARWPGWVRGAAAGMVEHLATWPLTTVVARVHPARDELPPLWGSGAAFAQACWRHLLFGAVLGELEARLNGGPASGPPPIPDEQMAATNGHGNLEHALSSPPA